jgi:hypothetical protein
MISQLIISKKLYHEWCRQLGLNDPISDGLTVSMFQDAVEIYVWTLVKERNIDVGKNPEFTNNLGSIANSGTSIPLKAKMLELNKARVNFKHYGILPAHREAERFRGYAQDFLVQACLEHFDISFNDISNINLIRSSDLREHFTAARESAESDDLLPAYTSLGKIKWLVLRELSARIPRFNAQRQTMDRAHAQDFETLRELLLVAIHTIDLREFKFASASLPTTHRTVAGEFRTNHHRTNYSVTEFNRIYDFLMELCLKESL